MRYIVKHMNNGDIGVYDQDKACFPFQGPELRAVGVTRAEWFRGKDGEAEANRLCEALNAHDQGLTPVKSSKAASAPSEGEADLRALADAIIEDERKARAS